ncbi:LapA family protein [Neisseria lactamica]|uniref:LapA family protein n=1 Tax=Neisseria lactamica TaxID=486 RepID=UPI0027E15953|nr:lipopolysaccharide assembly protein LapA domain-containing protein [Neisseria lactamica]
MKLIYTVVKIIILLLFLLLAVLNTDTVSFSYLPGQKFDLPLIAALFCAFAAGIVLGMSALFVRLLSSRAENGRLRAQIRKDARLTEPASNAQAAQNTAESTKQP